MTIVIDATDAIAGRLAAFVAKTLLAGEQVVVVNAEKAVISGPAKRTVNVYYKRRQMTQKANPENAAKWPRRPDMFLKRIVQGMLPKNKSRGDKALKNLRTFIGVPAEYSGKAEKFKADASRLKCKHASVQEICEALGWKTA